MIEHFSICEKIAELKKGMLRPESAGCANCPFLFFSLLWVLLAILKSNRPQLSKVIVRLFSFFLFDCLFVFVCFCGS
jgi:hypothetical protein